MMYFGHLKKIAFITFFCFGHIFPMELTSQIKEARKTELAQARIPQSVSLFKHCNVALSSGNSKSLPLVFDQPDGAFVINYNIDGTPVAQLVQGSGVMHFESRHPDKYNFLLKSPIKTGMLAVTTPGGFTFQQPVYVDSSKIGCNTLEFEDIFSSSNSLAIDVGSCKNHSKVTCKDLLFKGNSLRCMPNSDLHVSGSAALLSLKSLFNIGSISCNETALIDSDSVENYGDLKARNASVKSKKVFNDGVLHIGDSLSAECDLFDNRGSVDVGKDCECNNVGKFVSEKSSSWHVGGNWRAQIKDLNLRGMTTVGNIALLDVGAYANLGGLFSAPIIHINSKGLITCNELARLKATHHIGLKANGWIEFTGDILKKFIQVPGESDSAAIEYAADSPFALFASGVFFHSVTSGLKKSGSIISKSGSVILDAKKGLVHTGRTDAGFSKGNLALNAANVHIDKQSLLRALNAKLNAQESIAHQGVAQVKEHMRMDAPEITDAGTITSDQLVAKGNNITLSASSQTKVKGGYVEADEKVSQAGKVDADTLNVKAQDIALKPTSHVNGKQVSLQGSETVNHEGILHSSELYARAKYVDNSGEISTKNGLIKADRRWWNCMGSVSATDELTINALMSFNTFLGSIDAHTLTVNSAFDVNLFGIYSAKHASINTLIGLQAGIMIPRYDSFSDVVNFENFWSVGKSLALSYAPKQFSLAYSIYNGLKGIYTDFPALYNQGKELWQQEDTGVSDWIPLVCGAKNAAMSAVQTANMCKELASPLLPETNKQSTEPNTKPADKNNLSNNAKPADNSTKQDNTKKSAQSGNAQNDKQNTTSNDDDSNIWQTVGSHALSGLSTVASTVGPSINRDSLVDVNYGFMGGVNGSARSVWNVNNGICLFGNKYTVDTCYGSNSGAIAAPIFNIAAHKTYKTTGAIAGVSGSITAQDIEANRYIKTLSTLALAAKNKIKVDDQADISGSVVSAKAKDMETNGRVKGSNATVLDAEDKIKLGESSGVSGKVISMKGKSVEGEQGNTVQASEHTYIKTEELDNKGSTSGKLAVEFTGKAEQLKSIGTVDDLQYRGTLDHGLADTLAAGNGNVLKVNEAKEVALLADKQHVHLKEKHEINHGLKIKSEDNITADQPLSSTAGSIALEADKTITHHDISASGWTDIHAGIDVVAKSGTKRTNYGQANYKDNYLPVTMSAGKGARVSAGNDVFYEGVRCHSGKEGTRVDAGGKIISSAKICKEHKEQQFANPHRKNQEWFTDDVQKMHVSQYSSEGAISFKAGDTCDVVGTVFDSKEGTSIHGKNGVNLHVAYDTHEHETEYKKDGGWFGSTEERHKKNCSTTPHVVTFKGDKAPVISSDVEIKGVFDSDTKAVLNAPKIDRTLAKEIKESCSSTSSSNLVWQSFTSNQTQDVSYAGTHGHVESNAQRLHIETIDPHALEFVNSSHPDAHITRQFYQEIHKKHSETIQGPTKAATVVIALAVTMATSGMGASAGAALATACGVKSALGMAVISNMSAAAFASFNVQATDALLKNGGDPIKAAKSLANTETLKKLVLAAGTAGAMGAGGELLHQVGVPSVNQAQNLGERLLYAAPQETMRASIRTLAEVAQGYDIKESALHNLRCAAAGTLGTACSNEIGHAYAKDQIDPITHKLLHTVVGIAEGGIIGGKEGAVAGAMGAFVSETVADISAPKRPSLEMIMDLEKKAGRLFTQDEVVFHWNQQEVQYVRSIAHTAEGAKLITAAAALLAQQDVDIANNCAATAIDNNFVFSSGLFIFCAGMSIWNVYSAYNEGGSEAALKQLGIEVVTDLAGAGAAYVGGKICYRIGRTVYPTFEAAIKSVPGLEHALGSLASKIAVGVEKASTSSIGKRMISANQRLVHAESRLIQSTGRRLLKAGETAAEHMVPVAAKVESKAASSAVKAGVKAETAAAKAGVKKVANSMFQVGEGVQQSKDFPDSEVRSIISSKNCKEVSISEVGEIRAHNHQYKYHMRIRKRAMQDPVAHNFPYTFDDIILKSNPIVQKDGSLLFRHSGQLYGKEGHFEIALNPDTNTIFHRTFVGSKK